jgi:hypothetical protein
MSFAVDLSLPRYLRPFVQSPVRLFASLVFAGGFGLCVAVVGVGLLLSSPAATNIGPPPPDLPAEDVAIVSVPCCAGGSSRAGPQAARSC